jgi:nicotinamidase-related amidase
MGNAALVIIDVQNGILRPSDGPRADAVWRALDKAVARIAGMLDRARGAGVPVVHVQHDGGPDHRLAVGSKGWQIRAELTPLPNEQVVRKTACDAFFATSLEEQLRRRGIDHLVIAGCMTEYCIDTTVRRAVSLGFDVTLAADGHMTDDAGTLRCEDIIAHHNRLLDGFDAGPHQVTLQPCVALPVAI